MRLLFKLLTWLLLWPLLIIPKLWRIRFVGKPIAIGWSMIVVFFGLIVTLATQLSPNQQPPTLPRAATPIVNALAVAQVQNTPTVVDDITATLAATALPATAPSDTPTEVSAPTSTTPPLSSATATILALPTSTPLPTEPPPSPPTATPTQSPPVANAQAAQVLRIVDGDTIEVLLDGTEHPVRYIGIDTPERGQPGYQAATAANEALVASQTIYLVKEISETDRYERLLRQVYLADGRWVNGELAAQGWAQPIRYPPDILKATQLEALTLEAAQAQHGFWRGSSAYDGAMPYALTLQAADLRKGPSRDFEISGSVPANTPLTIFGRNETGDWVQVRLPDRAGGWMSVSLLAVNVPVASISVPNNVPGREIAVAPTIQPTPTATVVPSGPVVKQGANLRAGPGTNYAVIGNATKSQSLNIVGRNSDGTWFKLAGEEWIAASLVANPPNDLPVASAPPPPVQVEAPVQPVAVDPPPPAAQVVAQPPAQADCDPNYAGACIPNVSYDLDCPDVGVKDFRVVGYDHHRFDRDKDGIACES